MEANVSSHDWGQLEVPHVLRMQPSLKHTLLYTSCFTKDYRPAKWGVEVNKNRILCQRANEMIEHLIVQYQFYEIEGFKIITFLHLILYNMEEEKL